MTDKILTICTLQPDLFDKYQHCLHYVPLSNDATDQNWEQLLQQYHPRAIIFGLQNIDHYKISLWRKLEPNAKLAFVRKGTSLHRVDFAAAKHYQIEILNTAGVNAPFVADFVLQQFHTNQLAGKSGVLGIGDIGKKVVTSLLKEDRELLLYTRTEFSFNDGQYEYTKDLQKIFTECKQIAICLPLNEHTEGRITAQHVDAMLPHTQIVCISPPRVFSADAIRALDKRDDILVTFDHVASGLTFIYEALNRHSLRSKFIFEEKAAASPACQYAMGEEAIIKALQSLQGAI